MKREWINKNSKARSIVAMLFWEYKSTDRLFHEHDDNFNFAREQKKSEAYYCFTKAYKMLKN